MSAPERKSSPQAYLGGFLKGAAFSAFGLAGAGVLTMLTGVIFARWLNPEGFGLYSLAYVVVNVGGGSVKYAARPIGGTPVRCSPTA